MRRRRIRRSVPRYTPHDPPASSFKPLVEYEFAAVVEWMSAQGPYWTALRYGTLREALDR